MNKTINEIKATNNLMIWGLVNFLSIILLMATAKNPSLIYGPIAILGYVTSGMLIFYQGYSLGWEYKRISMDDAKVSNSEGGEK